ncbi:NAD(P)-dependent oxidoreductase [Mycolicibacterium goodii]|uniref:2-hydroxy-3-oxopropionate reductase n=1 Tax=Mycolicibacterium goodii TaxID=134601 RepID=A0A0K0X5Y0_MYCGD|nr:2-hydroxy-3-oxopropionate reductase [Mycolicibacterium goodii]
MKTVGFVGLGIMGQPMALNLVWSGTPLVVWNRTLGRCLPVEAAGAHVASNVGEVFARCETVLVMLADEPAIDDVLGCRTSAFDDLVRRHTVVQMGTVSPAYSQWLAERVTEAGGCYVEAPVSGSRSPAEAGELVAMLAGAPDDCAHVREVVAPMCAAVFDCGTPPNALLTKFAVNLYMICMVTGLAEAYHFAESHGLDQALLDRILDAGPMASAVSRVKSAKLAHEDFDVQAGLADVHKNTGLITRAARTRGIASPMLDACHALYGEAVALGHPTEDMAAVIHAIRARTVAA